MPRAPFSSVWTLCRPGFCVILEWMTLLPSLFSILLLCPPAAILRCLVLSTELHWAKGPISASTFFRRNPAHPAKLLDPRLASRTPLSKRSALGLVAIYNMLPQNVVGIQTVSAFQKGLQGILSEYAMSGHPQWLEVFSPRLPLASHPLTHLNRLPQ